MLKILNLNELIVNNIYYLQILIKQDHNLKLKIKIIGFRIKGPHVSTLLTNYPSDHDNNFQIDIIFEILELRNQHEDPRLYIPHIPYVNYLKEYRLIAHWLNNKYILYKPETEEIQRRLEQKNLKDVLEKYVRDDISEIYKGYC
jgi:hypothetical protein